MLRQRRKRLHAQNMDNQLFIDKILDKQIKKLSFANLSNL